MVAKKPIALRLDNVRQTASRRVILDVFSKLEGHVTIDDLLVAVRAIDRSIGSSTVYRTIRLLMAQGLVVERHFDGHRTSFERTNDTHHDHLICEACGAIVEFENDALEELQEVVAARHGYVLRAHRHELYGLCSVCRTKSTQKS